MRNLILGAAVIALASGGAYAQPGNGKGKDKGNDHRNHAAADVRVNAKANGSRARVQARGETRQENRSERRDDRQDNRAERRDDRQDNRAERRNDNDDRRRAVDRRDDDDDGRRAVVIRDRDDDDDRRFFFRRDRERGLIDGCPPGLAKKRNGCMPPGQVRDNYRTRFGYEYRPRLFGLTNYSPGRYYYDDGFLFRQGDRGGILGYIPLLGGALAVGNPWPVAYESYNVPDYYVDYYNLGGPRGYRYADNVLYRVNPEDAAITSIAALLTGNDITIGQPMPMGYDVYNVPYAYRDRYFDTPQARYRYSDGYVYRIDPTTQLVAAAIDLLV